MERQGLLRLEALPGEEFLHFIRRAATSDDVGRINTQFEAELRDGTQGVAALGLWACGKLAGAASYAVLPLRFQEGGWSGRVDVVATAPDARGHGVAALLLAGLMLEMHQQLESRWKHVSVVAVHPAIERLARQHGLVRIEGGETPLYFRDLDAAARQELHRSAASACARLRTELGRECNRCQRFVDSDPWCRPSVKGRTR